MAVTDDAILAIKQMLMDGEFEPGDKLPRERELAERLGLSRSSLREAVKALVMIRVLDVRQGDGTYVSSLEPALLSEALAFIVDLYQTDQMLSIFEVRNVLESAAAEFAATRASAEQIAKMQACLSSVKAEDGVDALLAHDLALHRTIAEASGNDSLAALIEATAHQTLRTRVWRGLTQKRSVSTTLAEHVQVVAAIADGKPDRARQAMRDHIAGVSAWLQESQLPANRSGSSGETSRS